MHSPTIVPHLKCCLELHGEEQDPISFTSWIKILNIHLGGTFIPRVKTGMRMLHINTVERKDKLGPGNCRILPWTKPPLAMNLHAYITGGLNLLFPTECEIKM